MEFIVLSVVISGLIVCQIDGIVMLLIWQISWRLQE
jgi:hypothetical protein